ncbi:Putative AC9 transposase [Linum grandiflorum]
MVRDIFGVPISSVSSESAFSTGGRILDSFRSSLTPSIVEALICSGDW